MRTWLRGQPKSFYLLLSLLAMLVLYPLALRSEMTQLVFRICFTSTVLGGIYAIGDNRRALYTGLALAVPSILSNVLLFFLPWPSLIVTTLMLGAAFFGYLIVTLMRHVLRDHQVSLDTIYCAVAAYMLMALFFTALFVLVEYVWPNSFKGEFTSNKFFRFSFADGFYFSVCTLTTVGFGDVLASGPEARCLTMMEAMLGVLYPAVLISRLVGLHTSSAGASPRPPASEAPPGAA